MLYTQIPSPTDPFTRRASHTDVFAQKPLQTNVFLHPETLHTPAPLHTKAFTHRCFCAGKAFTHKNPFPQFWTIDVHFVRETSTESKPNPNFPPVFDGQHAFGGAQGVRFMSMGTAGGSKDFIYMRMFSRRSIRLHLYACLCAPAFTQL